MTTAQKEQQKRRTILIAVKNLFAKKIENGSTIGKTSNWNYVNLKDVYEDLHNFLYWKDFTGQPYLISVEEVEHYVNLYREIDKSDKQWFNDWFKNN